MGTEDLVYRYDGPSVAAISNDQQYPNSLIVRLVRGMDF